MTDTVRRPLSRGEEAQGRAIEDRRFEAMADAEAQKRAIETLGPLRYGGGDYFWLNSR